MFDCLISVSLSIGFLIDIEKYMYTVKIMTCNGNTATKIQFVLHNIFHLQHFFIFISYLLFYGRGLDTYSVLEIRPIQLLVRGAT